MGRQYNRDSTIKPFAAKTDTDAVYKLNHTPRYDDAEQYIQAKLQILITENCIIPYETEIKHLYAIARESEVKNWSNSKTESEINRAVRQIINNHWR